MIDTFVEEALVKRLEEMSQRNDEISAEMSKPETFGDPATLQKLGREQRELQEAAELYGQLRKVLDELAEVQSMLTEADDADLRELAREDAERLEVERAQLVERAQELLKPRDPNDDRDVIIEIRAAEGGAEAGLWAYDLMQMYLRYAEGAALEDRGHRRQRNRSWRHQGGLVRGARPGRLLSIEVRERRPSRAARAKDRSAGAHPHVDRHRGGDAEADEVEVEIKDEDLKIDVYRLRRARWSER